MFDKTESTKTFHKIYLGIITSLVIAVVILLTMTQPFGAGTGQEVEPVPLLLPLLNNVVQNVGVDFESGQPIVIDSLTGREITPCRQSDVHPPGENDQNSDTTCKTELRRSGRGYQLFDVETQRPIQSRIVEVVLVLWEGSSCNTTFAGGFQYETCHNIEDICMVLQMLGQNGSDCF